MKTVNSLSGGKTSSYIAANYPADHNVFSLVRTNDLLCLYKDAKLSQMVSDKIGMQFVGTLEQDSVIKSMFDLEQKIGTNIEWVTGLPFEDIIDNKKAYLPNLMTRYCTTEMKMKPIFKWWQSEIGEVVEMRIGYRANETKRVDRMVSQLNQNGVSEMHTVIGRTKTGTRNRWGMIPWRVPSFPLVGKGILQQDITDYWNNNRDVDFKQGYYNNCVGCFHRNPLFLNKMAQEHPNKMEWFAKQEERTGNTFIKGTQYKDIIQYKPQAELSFDDFSDCDSGFCGL